VLEEHPAVHEIDRTECGVLAERFAPERRIDPEPGERRVGRIAGVDANAMIAAEFAEERQERAAPAADVQEVLVVEGVSLDQLICQAVLKTPEDGGMGTRPLIDGRLIDKARIERCIEDQAAGAAEREHNVTARDSDRFFPARQQQSTVSRHTPGFMERVAIT
jgi:hypothetical protein